MENVAGRWAAGGSLAPGPLGQNPSAVARLQEGGSGRALAALDSSGKGRLGEGRPPPQVSRLCSREGGRQLGAGGGGSVGMLPTGSAVTPTPTAGMTKPR